MSVELSGPGGRLLFATNAWVNLIDLAQDFGWMPDHRLFRDQEANADDAECLADALTLALQEVPAERVEHTETPLRFLDDQAESAATEPIVVATNSLQYFSGPDGRKSLSGMIDYCRCGGFHFRII